MNASDLTLASTVALELGVEATDARLPRLVAVASAAVARYLNRAQLHYQAGRVDKVPGFGRVRLVLDLAPVLSIASIVLPDSSTVDPAEYSIENAEAGLLYRSVGWPQTGLVRAGLLYADRDSGTEASIIVATYTGGWVTPAQAADPTWSGPARSLPYDLEEAVVQTAAQLHRKGGQDGTIASETLGAYSVSYRLPNSISAGIIPDAVVPILNRYRWVTG